MLPLPTTRAVTSESLKLEKPKAKRRGLPKTKSGCRTCKLRRVKCGEEKPECFRCLKFGMKCDGYSLPETDSRQYIQPGRVILPRKKPMIPIEPSISLFAEEQEQRYFDIFCSKTAFDILPRFDSGTLREILLQTCMSEPSIRHAVVALGALDMTAETQGDTGTISLDNRKGDPYQHHQNALKQYTTAIKHMKIASASGKQDLRTTLLTCLVILCFEAWNGNHHLAVQQIQLGFKLIRAWQDEHAGTRPGVYGSSSLSGSQVMEDDLVKTFSRLDVQAVSFAEERTPDRGSAVVEEIALLNKMPNEFTSLVEAEVYESALVRETMRFLSSEVQLPKPHLPTFPVNGWWGETSSSCIALQQRMIAYATHWKKAFDQIWERYVKENDAGTFVHASMLRMHVETVCLALVGVCMEDEENFDSYNDVFADIVNMAECSLQALNSNKSSRRKFQFDSHVVIPLYMTGYKCRDPKMRRRAISSLLAYPRREGVFDSLLAGKMTQWAMNIEEEHMENGKVPGWARIHGVTFERDGERRSAILTCQQRTSALSAHIETKRKIITW